MRKALFIGSAWLSSLVAAEAAITLVPNPADYGLSPTVMTADPEPNTPAQRGITGTRQLRQTFQVSSTIEVTNLVLSLALTANSAGLDVEIFEIMDVTATSSTGGTLIHSFSIATGDPIPATTQRVGFDFTGSDTWTLPQRNSGNEGYAIQLSNGDGVTTIGNVRHSNSGTDVFTGGRFYTETGAQSGTGNRDIGLSISGIAVPEPTIGLMSALGLMSLVRRRRLS